MPLYTDQIDMESGAAHKGDAGLHVEFYEKKLVEPINEAIGRLEPIERKVVYCRIVIPGDKCFTHDQPARDCDKQRFPRHWLAFNMTNTPEGQVYGTSLKQWNMDDPTSFNDNQLIEMQSMRFQTVEQIAGMNDMQMQRVGMGAASLKVGARQYLDSKNRSHEAKELDETKKALADLQRQMADFISTMRPVTSESPEVLTPQKMTPAERMAIVRAARGKGKATGGQHTPPVGAASHG